MATIKPSIFTEYDLTDQEQRAAIQLTELNKMWLQNQAASMAREKVTAPIEDDWNYRLHQAHLQGAIEFIQYFVQLDEAEKTRLLEEAQEEARKQNIGT